MEETTLSAVLLLHALEELTRAHVLGNISVPEAKLRTSRTRSCQWPLATRSACPIHPLPHATMPAAATRTAESAMRHHNHSPASIGIQPAVLSLDAAGSGSLRRQRRRRAGPGSVIRVIRRRRRVVDTATRRGA
jgi:hypothetical protein